MEAHAISGPLTGALTVIVGILVGVGPRGYARAFWRPDRSMGFALYFLVGLCILYATASLLDSM